MDVGILLLVSWLFAPCPTMEMQEFKLTTEPTKKKNKFHYLSSCQVKKKQIKSSKKKKVKFNYV